jgi:hypothetical protein
MKGERKEVMVPSEEEINGLPYSDMSPAARFVNIFVSPKETFMSLTRSKWAWIIPILIVFAVEITFFLVLKPVIMEDLIHKFENSKLVELMPESDREQALTKMKNDIENPPLWRWLVGPVEPLAKALIVAAILLLIGNIILGGDAKFTGMLHVYAFASLIAVPETIIKGILVHMKQSMDVHTSLALLMPSGDTSSFLFNFLDKIDIFAIWLLAVVTIGMSVFLPKVMPKKIGIWVTSFWLVWIIFIAALSMFTGGMFGI